MTEPDTKTVVVQVLGPVGLRNGVGFKPVRGQQGEVLAMLAAAYPGGVQTDTLIEALWGDTPPKTVRTGLAVVLHRLRDRLGSNGRLATEHGAYRLELDVTELDASLFNKLVAAASEAHDKSDHRQASEYVEQALELWRGDAFQPFEATDSLRASSIDLNERRRDAEELSLDVLLADGRSDDAATWASKLVGAAPYREQRWFGLALALYRAGRQTEALRALGDATRTLRDDIGVEPGPALRKLELDILDQSSALLLATGGETVPADGNEIGSSESLPLLEPVARVGDPATSFLGRSDDIGSVVSLLDSNQFVTVLGQAGSGKTRVAARLVRSASTRTVWLDLVDLESDQVVAAFASQLGLSAPAHERLDRIARELRTTPTLVVLDNCEHVLPAAAELAEAIIDGVTSTQVLATSRTPLGCRNESCFPLPPLSIEAGVELLCDRAYGGGSTPNLDHASAERLVRKLGLNPLLIELVAEPVRSLSVESVDQQLERVLTAVDPEQATDRHSSLIAAIDWSVDLLDPAAEELHSTLGVMRGGFSAQDVAAITHTDTATLDGQLANLCSHGLLTTEGGSQPTRYRQAEAIGIHARQRLRAAGRAETAFAAHTDACVDLVNQLAPELWTKNEPTAVQQLGQVRDQLIATHERLVATGDVERSSQFALKMWEYSFLRLDIAQFGWMDDVIKLDGIEQLPEYGDVLGTAAFAAWAQNNFFESSRLADAAIAVAGDGPVSLQALRARFNVASFNEPGRGPMEAFGALIGATLERGAPHLQSDLQVLLALGLSQIGEAVGADRAASEAIRIAEETANPSCIAWATYGVGWTKLDDDPVDAARSFLASARLARSAQNRFVEAMAQGALVTSALRRGRPAQARGLLIDVIAMWNRLESTPQLIRSCREAVLVLADQGETDRARSALAHVELLDLGHPLAPKDQRRFDELVDQLGATDEAVGFDPQERLADSIIELLQAD